MSVYVICPEETSLAIYSGQTLINRIPIEESLIKRGEIAEAYSGAVAKAVTVKKERESGAFLLPQGMYGVDYISLPLVGKSRHEGLLRIELKARHKICGDITAIYYPVRTEKTSVTYCVIMSRKSLLERISAAFAGVNIRITAFVPAGIAAIEGAALISPEIKTDANILFMSEEKRSYIIEIENGRLSGDGKIPYGTEALSDEAVLTESSLYSSSAARKLVITAQKKAKSAASEINDMSFGEEKEGNPDDIVGSFSDFLNTPAPNAPHEFITENFRLFERRILAAARELEYGEAAIKINSVYLYLPARYAFIAEDLNKTSPTIKWINLADKYGEARINRLLSDGISAMFSTLKPPSAGAAESRLSIFKKRALKEAPDAKEPPQKNTPLKKNDPALSAMPYFKI